MVHGPQALTILTKGSVLGVCVGSEYDSEFPIFI